MGFFMKFKPAQSFWVVIFDELHIFLSYGGSSG